VKDKTTFAHLNIVARNWRQLAQFYQQVFDCRPVPPERSLSGPHIERATRLPGARIEGIHLRLPGYGDDGPTLEIFQYAQPAERPPCAIHRPGLAHIAFAVADVEATRQAVLAAGGGEVGEVVSLDVADAGRVTFVYLTDPEGNVIELQHWSQP